jgi:hypothetical protein
VERYRIEMKLAENVVVRILAVHSSNLCFIVFRMHMPCDVPRR